MMVISDLHVNTVCTLGHILMSTDIDKKDKIKIDLSCFLF